MGESHMENLASPMDRVAAPLREQVSSFLRQAILESEYKPGQRLIERELISRLQVSRATIRESLRELVSEGLVSNIPQKGAVVTSISRSEAQDLYDARIAIESLVVARFIERASDQQIEQLKEAVAKFRKGTENLQPIRELIAMKDDFYDVLIKGAESPILSNLLSSLHARVSRLRAKSMSSPGRGIIAVAEVEALVDAIADRDTKRAQRLCATHVKNAAKEGIHAVEKEIREKASDLPG